MDDDLLISAEAFEEACSRAIDKSSVTSKIGNISKTQCIGNKPRLYSYIVGVHLMEQSQTNF